MDIRTAERRHLKALLDICEAEVRARKWGQKWAELRCPYTVGQVITIRAQVYTGKQGIVKKVECVQKGWFGSDYEWQVVCYVLKKNGEEMKYGVAVWTETEEEQSNG